MTPYHLFHVSVENERLKNDIADLKQQNERTAEVRTEAGASNRCFLYSLWLLRPELLNCKAKLKGLSGT